MTHHLQESLKQEYIKYLFEKHEKRPHDFQNWIYNIVVTDLSVEFLLEVRELWDKTTAKR